MKTRHKPMTLEEHYALGAKLKQIHSEMIAISLDLAKRYGKHLAYPQAVRATDGIEKLRSFLDGQIERDCPGVENMTLNNAYYGKLTTEPVTRVK